ncbi:hypothetical protein [Parasitella parasitica]|uniref:Peptidase M24 domain-containing protein n=1 Tax=Parasitella parasitica TaxID=35722 RepID=A0A0B7N584_9FUNG|nr:hypothetical protein [Parasitella parasitica]
MSSEDENTPLFNRTNRGTSHWNRLKKSTMLIRAAIVFFILAALATGTCLLQRCLSQGDTLDLSPLDGFCSHIDSIQPNEYIGLRRAQESVLNQTGAGTTCAQVDLTARHIIEKGGFGKYFTHRLGHGIGLRLHDEPYMHQGNTHQYLEPGMTFSVEPGIYVTNEFGYSSRGYRCGQEKMVNWSR